MLCDRLLGRTTIGIFAIVAILCPETAIGTSSIDGGAGSVRSQPVGFKSVIKPFLNQYCVRCHGERKPRAEVSLQKLTGDFSSDEEARLWTRVLDQLTLSQMPPEGARPPSTGLRERMTDWIRGELVKHGRSAENKLLLPAYGNYVAHEELFDKTPKTVPMPPPRFWRVRPAVYNATISSVSRDGKVIPPFGLNSSTGGFRDYANLYKLSGPDVELLLQNAKETATRLTMVRINKGKLERLSRSMPNEFLKVLDPKHTPTKEELQAAVNWQFRRVLLREPKEQERDRFMTFMERSMKNSGRLLGLRNMIAAVLLRPEVLYRVEQGSGKVDKYGRVMLSPREIAYALSYSLTNQRPDNALLKAMEEGKLKTSTDVAREVRRMLDDPRLAKPRLLEFFREYFDYPGAVDIFKDRELFRDHEAQVLVNDTDQLILHILKQDKDVLRELLTTNKSFVNYRDGKQASNRMVYLSYNLPRDWKWTPLQPVELPAKQRAGILTQPSWLVAMSTNFDNHAILRGKWIRERLLGGTVPDLPIAVDAQLPEDEKLTLREKMNVTRENYCWKCHQRMNPLGLPFEQFDPFGRWRTRELEKPVITTGHVENSGEAALEGKVDEPISMIRKLADSKRVRQVFVRHAFRFFMGRNEQIHDASTLQASDRAYAESGGSMKALVVSLLSSDSFLYRTQPQPLRGKKEK